MWVGPFLSCLLSDQAEVTLLLLPLLVLSWSCTPLETCAFCLAMARSLAIALLLLAPLANTFWSLASSSGALIVKPQTDRPMQLNKLELRR